MFKKLRCAVIGVGNMGKNHVRVYSEIKDVDLIAVADLDNNLGCEVSKKFKTKYYKDYKRMVKKEKIDVISICVPTSSHYKVSKFCIENKINVLLEKPISKNINEAKKLLVLTKKNNIKFLVGHVERFNPAIKKTKEIIDKGELGNIISIIARRVGGFPPQIKDANITVDLAIHDIDVANYLLSELPYKVYSNKQKNHIEKREDSMELFLQYKTTSVYIQANWLTPVKIRKLNITGTEGYLEMDYISQNIEFYKSNYEKFKESINGYSDYILRFSEPDKIIIPSNKKEPLKEEILYFINCVKNNININSKFAIDALRIALT